MKNIYNYYKQYNQQQIMRGNDYNKRNNTAQKYSLTKTFTHRDMLNVTQQLQAVSKQFDIQNLIDQYKDVSLRSALTQLKNQFQSYQKIRGDGNCFIRAVAFQYLVTKDQYAFDRLFPHLNKLRLNQISPKSIPEKFKKFFDDTKLKTFFKKCWQEQFQLFFQLHRDFRIALYHLLNRYPMLDFVIILYFRSLCLKYYQDHYDQYKHLLHNNQQKIIKNYGDESQGLIIHFMGQALEVNIIIKIVNKPNLLSTQVINTVKDRKNIFLFLRTGHYDILYKPKKPIEEIINWRKEKEINPINQQKSKKSKQIQQKIEEMQQIKLNRQIECKTCLNFDDKQCMECLIKKNSILKRIVKQNMPLSWWKNSSKIISS